MSQHDLILQYRKAIKDLGRILRRTDDPTDRRLISQMISDCEYVNAWLSTGREPSGSKRGIDRRSVYELTKVWDPEWFETYVLPVQDEPEYCTSLADEQRIKDALAGLTERQRQCYILTVGFGYSQRQVAAELQIDRTTVQEHLASARQRLFSDSPLHLPAI